MGCCCRVESCVRWSAVLLVASALLVGGIQLWLREKTYVFSQEKVAVIARNALEATKGKGYNATLTMVEAELRAAYDSHIIPESQMEWIFMNAGGWMGAMYILHASTTEYVMFFGTAIHTSGHSGRYWANISDTLIAGTFRQWKEGTTEAVEYSVGDTIVHVIGDVAAIQWSPGTWMVEYGRGFIPSTLGFALSDTIFCTQDFYLLYRILRIYLIALVQELVQGSI